MQVNGMWRAALTKGMQVPIWLTVLLSVSMVYFGSPAMDGTGDPDYYWHILYAKWIMANGQIPQVDFISWPFEGQPYLLTQWLGQVLIGSAAAVNGSYAVALLTLAAVLATVVLGWRAAKERCDDSLTAFIVGMAATSTFWSTYARPQMFSFITMISLVWLVDIARKEGWTVKRMLMAGVIMCTWVNLHGSYVVGLVYLGLMGAAEFTQVLFEMKGKDQLKAVVIKWAKVMAVACGATLLNPNGINAWVYVVEIAGLQSTTTGIIMEWAPTSFGTGVGSSYILLLLGTIMAMAISKVRPSTQDLAVVAGMGIFGLMASRQAFYSTLALVPMLAFYASRTALGELVAQKMKPSIPAWAALSLIGMCVGIGLCSNEIRGKGLENWKKRIFPVEAAAFIKENKLDGKLFNEVTSGGYLAHETGLPVYVDGRMDLYKDEHFFEWFYARMGTPIWKEKLKDVGADLFVLQNQSPITQLLMQSGEYAMVHADATYAVIVPKIDKYADLIARSKAKQPEFKIFNEKGKLLVTPMGY